MTKRIELTRSNLLEGVASEVRSSDGPGAFTKDFNESLINEFRSNDGIVPGDLEQFQFLLLTTTGARSGKQRTTPLAYIPIDGRILIIASSGGRQRHPAWYWNLIANPSVTVELGGEAYQAAAIVLEGEERNKMFAEVVSRKPNFGDYQRRTDRLIPVVELRRIEST
jgi:deazaflavin-dependent oxidoreductase (nitroreductase family)